MEKFYLEEPSLNRKLDALEYLQEHVKYNSELNGTGSMDKCISKISYEEWLEELEKRKDIEYLEKIKKCPSKTFFLIRENDNKLIGMINVRYNISEERLKNGASHIGYGIRPTERRKGYNKINLYLGLLEEQKLGEENVLLDCTIDNEGSNKTILALGGKLEKTEIDPSDNTLTNYYWIDVNESINTFSPQYNDFIYSNNNKNFLKKNKIG